MGFLTAQGKVLTYNEYKDRKEEYKQWGLEEFIAIWKAHKDRKIPQEALHWGEEVEYALFYFDEPNRKVKLVNNASILIRNFNEEHGDREIHLQPEFGNWMVEAVPAEPYGALEDPS